jgi:Tol biopolymer transport system component
MFEEDSMGRRHTTHRPPFGAPADSCGGGRGRWSSFGRIVLGAATATALAVLCALSVAGAPAEAAFPGVNGRIACEGIRKPIVPGTSSSEIFSVNPDGSGERVLTNNTTRDGDPAFSPDGRKVAFEAQRDPTQPNNSDIYVANNDGDLEGPDVKRLTFNNGTTVIPGGVGGVGVISGTGGVSGTDRAPSWSPDGTQIVFHSGRAATFSDGGTTPANDFEIYKMSATTGESVMPAQRLTFSRGQDATPSWSPDGTRIAFQSLRASDATHPVNLEVFTMNPDGSGVTNVTNSPGTAGNASANSNGLDRDVIWWPNSAQLAFSSTRNNVTAGNQNFEVYKANRDGSNPTRLTSNLSGDTAGTDGDYDAPNSWSPDGKRILFTTGRSSTADTSEFIANTMDANAGEAAGLQRVAATNIFVRCDWQRAAPAAVGGGGSVPPGGSVRPKATVCASSKGVRVIGQTNSGGRVFQGSNGNDRICGTNAGDVITGNGGRDVISGGGANDRINGGSGNDRVNGGAGKDLISGSSGNDRISGSSGNDRINGNSGRDAINGNSGNDRLTGATGNDVVSGSSGRDVISGSSGNDRLSGNSGNDRINGNSGNDRISGGSGRDVLRGSTGKDRISGGPGKDRISGGSGKDHIKQ